MSVLIIVTVTVFEYYERIFEDVYCNHLASAKKLICGACIKVLKNCCSCREDIIIKEKHYCLKVNILSFLLISGESNLQLRQAGSKL